MVPPARCHDFPARVVASVICGVRVGSSAKDQHRSARAPHIAGRHIIRWRHRRACHLSQRFGADRSDHRRANCQQRHPRPWADRLHDVALAPYSRSDRAPLCSAGRHRGISCRARPRAHRHTRRRLATGSGSCGRDHRGSHGLGAHGALCPAPDAGQGIAAGVTPPHAEVAGQSRLSPRRSSFRGWLLAEPVSDRHQRVTTAVAAALDRTEAASRWMRHDPPCGRCVAGVRTCSGALLYARVSFPSPHEGGLLCGLLDFRHVFSSVLSDRREPPGL